MPGERVKLFGQIEFSVVIEYVEKTNPDSIREVNVMISIRSSLTLGAATLSMLLLGGVVLAQDAPGKTEGDKSVLKERKQRVERRAGEERFRADRERGFRRGFRGGFLPELRGVELTDDQKSQIKLLAETHFASNKAVHEELRSIMDKRRDGTLTDADKARAEEIHQSMKASAEQFRSSVLALLTPEQTEQIERMKAERKERMEKRKERLRERHEKRMQERSKSAEEPKTVDQR